MSDALEHSAGGETFEIRCLQSLDADPLFSGARYTFAVEGAGRGFEVQVRIAPIYVHLLTLPDRLKLRAQAAELVARLLDDGVRKAAQVRVSADGIALHDGKVLEVLLPLVKKPAPAKPAAAH